MASTSLNGETVTENETNTGSYSAKSSNDVWWTRRTTLALSCCIATAIGAFYCWKQYCNNGIKASADRALGLLSEQCRELKAKNEFLGERCFELEKRLEEMQTRLKNMALSEARYKTMYHWAKDNYLRFVIFAVRQKDPPDGTGELKLV